MANGSAVRETKRALTVYILTRLVSTATQYVIDKLALFSRTLVVPMRTIVAFRPALSRTYPEEESEELMNRESDIPVVSNWVAHQLNA